LARVTSSLWEKSSCTGLGSPLTNSLPACLNRLEHSVEIVYQGHTDITSMALTHFP